MSRGSHHVLARTSIPLTAVSYTPVTYTGGTLTAGVASVTPSNATYSTPTSTQVNAGTYSTSITGTGAFNDTVSANWTINRASMVSVGFASQTYTGSALTPAVNSVNPAAATYSTSAVAKTNAGTYSDSSVTGTGNYTGTVTGNFTINPASLVSFTIGAQTYTGSPLTPAVASVNPAAATYSTSFTNQTNAGTYSNSITGTTNYTGTVNANFVINPATVTAITWTPVTYNGASQTPATASRTPAAATGTVGTAQTNAGTYSTTFTGTGNYTGTPSANWTINPATVTFSYTNTSKTYNGSSQAPTVTPSNGSATYSNGGTTAATNAGSYTITSAASGNYTGSGSSAWSIAKADQATVSISGATTGTSGNSYSFSAAGGTGTGSYVFGGSGSGSTNPNSVYFGSPGSYSVTVYKASDTNYNQSNTASTSITISNPVEYIYAGNIGGSNGTSYINVSWSTQQVQSGSPIYFYINAYAEDGGNIEWTDPYYTFWTGASGNYTVNSEGNAFFDKAGRNSFSGTFSITPNAPGYFNWGIRIYNPGAGVENHAVPIGVQVSY